MTIKDKKIRLKDIAEALNLSVNTISKALTGNANSAGISFKTAERIIIKAKQMGYSPNIFARSLVKGKSNIVGILASPEEDSFYTSIIYSIEKELVAKGLIPVLVIASNEENGTLKSINLLSQLNVSSIIIIGDSGIISSKAINKVWPIQTPIISIGALGYQRSESKHVNIDFFAGAYSVVNHLLAGRHKNIVFINSLSENRETQGIQLGWEKALAEKQLTINPELLFGCENNSNIMETALDIVEESFVNNSPTAFVCFNDKAAFGIICGLRKKGISIPKEVAVTGFKDFPESSFYTPTLTTLKVSTRLIVTELIKYVFNQNNKNIDEIKIVPRLIVRNST